VIGYVAWRLLQAVPLVLGILVLTFVLIHLAPGEGWVWQTGTVIDSAPGSLTYQYVQLNTSYQIPRAGNAFYLTGKLQMLDSPGEFFRDPATGSLYLVGEARERCLHVRLIRQ